MMLPILCLIATIGIYWGVRWGYKRTRKLYMFPVIIVPALLILIIVFTEIPLATYQEGTQVLVDMLQPATIALAIPLYKYFDVLKKYALEICTSVVTGSLISVLSTAIIASWVHLNSQMITSMIPRSVTTPIAMDVSENIGGSPSITAAIVIMTGLMGSVIGPFVIQKLRIHNEISRGVLLGTGAHAIGTAKAFEFSTQTGAISSVSMILAAMFTLSISPWLAALFN